MNEETISLKEALKKTIIEFHDNPIIALHEISWYLCELYKEKYFKSIRIGKITSSEPDNRVINSVLQGLIKSGFLSGFLSGVSGFYYLYTINGRNRPTAQQVMCCVNPCSYISYFSAMEWHGITDRIPKKLHISHSSQKFLKGFISKKIKEELPNVRFRQPLYPQNILGINSLEDKKIVFHEKTSFKMKSIIHGTGGIRVTSVGETFLDMLKKPIFCGGFEHVISVFRKQHHKYLQVIINEISKNGNSMDKARAGYILEDILGVKDKKIDLWKNDVKRGGSRKLIPNKPYVNKFSETWCISINN